jgi:hypothetical protein
MIALLIVTHTRKFANPIIILELFYQNDKIIYIN